MNGQQSPSAPDPHDESSVTSGSPSGSPLALSDQEAFSLLAESMANGKDPTGRERNAGVLRPVVPIRTESSLLAGLAGRSRGPNTTDRSVSNRHRFDWSTPILVDDQWEVMDGSEPAPIHGQITEVIDLTQVPPITISTDGDGQVTVLEPDPTDSTPLCPPSPSLDLTVEPDAHSHILPPKESIDDRPLPPLVFLDTRGDVVPRHGETTNGRNGDRFDEVVDIWGDAGPPDGSTTSASGVDMAESRADFNSVAKAGSLDERAHGSNATSEFVEATATPAEQAIEQLSSLGVDGESGSTGSPVIDDAEQAPVTTNHPNQLFTALEEGSVVDSGRSPVQTAVVPQEFDSDADSRLDELHRVFDQYSGPVIAVIASIANERRAIDEALQCTFEAVWKTIDTFDPEQPRGPWMFTLARRQAAEQIELSHRLDRESKPGGYPVPSHRKDEAIAVDKSWEAWEVRLAVDQLNPAEHDVLRLIHNEGLIHPEIAAQMRTTVGAVKSHAYSGSHRLVELLDHVIRPDATEGLTVDQASALTWYLAGVADGSDLVADERSAVKRVQAQLASATAWINPDGHAKERVISHARRTLDDPGPLVGTVSGQHRLPFGDSDLSVGGVTGFDESSSSPETGAVDGVESTEGSPKRRWLIGGLIAVGLLAVVGVFQTVGGSGSEPDKVRRYQMLTSGVDADATGVVEITTAPTGSRYDFEFGGLDASSDDYFYTAWLQSTAQGAVVPLGSFSWGAAGDPLALSGPTWSDSYDLLVVTRSETMTRVSIDDPLVLSVSIE